MIFETHAHYDDRAFEEDREALLGSLEQQGIGRVVNVGSGLRACAQTIELMNRYSFIYGALGIHPSDSGELTEEDMLWLKEQSRHEKCVAIGEIGLDYYWNEPDPAIQKKWFRRQLRLAGEVSLPVVIHSRDAARDTIDIMKEEKAEDLGGVIHCYSYSRETARIFLDMGYFIGIGGVLTFKNGKKLKEVAEYVPMDRIVLETDSPYLSPEPNRGKRNSSLNLHYVVQALAQMKGLTAEEVEQITWENACRLYRMKS